MPPPQSQHLDAGAPARSRRLLQQPGPVGEKCLPQPGRSEQI